MTLHELWEKNGELSLDEIEEYFAEKAFRETPIERQVYETLTDNLVEKYRLPWVEPIFVPGNPCYEAYGQIYEACKRLQERLGVIDEDEDTEIILDSLMEYSELLALEMFRYGRKYQRMQEQSSPAIPGE